MQLNYQTRNKSEMGMKRAGVHHNAYFILALISIRYCD